MSSAPMAESPPGLGVKAGRRRGLTWLLPQPAALLLPLLLVLSACDVQPEPLLRVGANRWPGYEPLYLARDLNLYDSARVRVVEFPSASDVVGAFRNGMLEAAALTMDEALLLMQEGVSLKFVAVLDESAGGDALLASGSVRDLADLRGRRVAVENTAVGALLLDSALEEAGLPLERITVVPLAVDRHKRAFLSGEVDAVVTFEPVCSRLLGQGAHVLFDSNRIPGRILDVLVVERSVAERDPAGVRYLLHGYFTALARRNVEPKEADRLLAARQHLPEAELGRLLLGFRWLDRDGNGRYLGGESPRLRKTLADLGGYLERKGLLSQPVALEADAVDAGYLPEATP